MRETKWPEGPWTASTQEGQPGHCFCAQVFGADGDSLGDVDPTEDPAIANAIARLWAVAPKLYEALASIRRQGELACVDAGGFNWGSSGKKPPSKDVFQFPRHMLTEIDEALREARGES